MRRFAAAVALALTLAGSANADVFRLVEAPVATPLPSAEVPNAAGSLVLPTAFTTPPVVPATLPYVELEALWQRAGAAYGIPWQVLAAINKIESNFGQNMGPSSAGAVGWMQFMPSTWLRWGLDADGDRVADPWDPHDAVFAASRYLAAAGGRTDLPRGVFAYNHAQWYVDDVLELAGEFQANGVGAAFTLERPDPRVDDAEDAVAAAGAALERAVRAERALRRLEEDLLSRVEAAELLSDRLAAHKRAVQMGYRRDAVLARIARLQGRLRDAENGLSEARRSAEAASFAPTASGLVAAPAYVGGYVFPVGGGPSIVSVSRDHHDYPAADIAAPEGAPVYALADATVIAAWPNPMGRCGIGLSMQAADGQRWTYCHLLRLEPAVQAGTVVTAGALLGLVGSTGRSSGPHLHLQLAPATEYPQQQAWFQSFAGTAFRWQGEAPEADSSHSGSLFAVVPEAPETDGVVAFTTDES